MKNSQDTCVPYQFLAPEILHLQDVESKDPMKASDVLAFTYKVDIFSVALCCAGLSFDDYEMTVEAELCTKVITEEGRAKLTEGLKTRPNNTQGAFSGVYGLMMSALSCDANPRPEASVIAAAMGSTMDKLV